jgi:glycosyltransferase involved in cell wall biosynthesis
VHNILRKDEDMRRQFRVLFAGPRNQRTERLVNELQLADVVELLGFVPHHESLQLMVNADVLLLLMAREEAANKLNGTIMVPGKTYEYLGARRPILALVPEGAVAELIRETASGTVVAPDEPAGIEEAIIALFRAWQSGTLGLGTTDVSRYERKALAPRLAAILESCCQARARLQTMIPPRFA